MPLSPSGDVLPFCGYVDTTADALRLIQAARCGIVPRITRRLNELERRAMIKSGAVFVFSVEESGIKRWTDGAHGYGIGLHSIPRQTTICRLHLDAKPHFWEFLGQFVARCLA